MKKFFTNIFLDVFSKIIGIQIKYQSFVSKEFGLEMRLIDIQNEISFGQLRLSELKISVKKLEEKNQLNEVEIQEVAIKKQEINRLLHNMEFHIYTENNLKNRLDIEINKRKVFENENPKYFNSFK